MLKTLSTIFFVSTIIIDLASTVTLCGFTFLIYKKVEVSATLEEQCETCKTHLLFMKVISNEISLYAFIKNDLLPCYSRFHF